MPEHRPPGNGAELELLLFCASPGEDESRVARILDLLDGNLPGNRIDWNVLLHLADVHRLSPLLYRALHAIRPAAIPERLETGFRNNLKHSLLLTRDLLVLVELLRREGLPALPFKGPTLALDAYGDTALRGFRDLDILVRREDVWLVRDLLLSEGYKSARPLSPRRESACLKSCDELVMTGPGGWPLVEIHWAFAPPHFAFDFDMADCWPRIRETAIGNRRVPALQGEDLLLVLSVHGAKHCWSHFGLICDVAWLVAAEKIDWERLLNRARRLGVHRMVLLAAALADRYFGLTSGPDLQQAFESDPALPVLMREIARNLLMGAGKELPMRLAMSLHLRMRERLRDRWSYLFSLATRQGIEDWDLVDLPKSLGFLYPLLRYPRLAMKYGRGV